METKNDFASLRNLLALKRLDIPMDTEVDRFLIEFHRRQRAQLLVPASRWETLTSWVKETAASFGFVPSLSYGCAVAAIALTAFVGLSQQVQVTHVDGQYKLSLLTPGARSGAGDDSRLVRDGHDPGDQDERADHVWRGRSIDDPFRPGQFPSGL